MLSGWKEISSFLGVSIRTAKKYFYDYGMPVVRLPTGKPVLFKDLLKEWLINLDKNIKAKQQE